MDQETVDNELRDQVAAFIANYYGDECDTFEETCIICRQWKAFRQLFELPEKDESKDASDES